MLGMELVLQTGLLVGQNLNNRIIRNELVKKKAPAMGAFFIEYLEQHLIFVATRLHL